MSDKENENLDKLDTGANLETKSLYDSSGIIGGEIGPYKLLSILGEGGAGIVYLAEQKHPIKRQVALKIIKPGMDSKQVIARFEAERQALALLDHPNIAHVITAGSTEAGRPYFVMEYIQGMTITNYCDYHQLSLRERLKLFIPVCEAVQHAHQKGLIHRDIKPSNIIVSVQNGKPVPKVIDFGVAKALTMPLTEKTVFTRQDQLIGTPEYMSPEQAGLKENDIDTRSDVYSLGVVLYELLAGTLPFEPETLREDGYTGIQRVLRECNPPRPSTKLSSLGENAAKVAQRRQIELSALIKSLHKELEWIPLMAIRKERDQRYKTASDLAEDIQNYLDGNPLVAGPESLTYRSRKFIQRNMVYIGSFLIIVWLLIGVLGLIKVLKLNNINAFKLQAKMKLDEGMYEEAKEQFLKIQALDESNKDAQKGINEAHLLQELSTAQSYIQEGEYDRALGITDTLHRFSNDQRVLEVARIAKGISTLYVECELGQVTKATLMKIEEGPNKDGLELSSEKLLNPEGVDIDPGWHWLTIHYKPSDTSDIEDFGVKKYLLFVPRSQIYRLQCKNVIVGNDPEADFVQLEDAFENCQPGNIINLLPGEHRLTQNTYFSIPNISVKSFNPQKQAVINYHRSYINNTWDVNFTNLKFKGNYVDAAWPLVTFRNTVSCKVNNCTLETTAVDVYSSDGIEVSHNLFTKEYVHHRFTVHDSQKIVFQNNTVEYLSSNGYSTVIFSGCSELLICDNNLHRSGLTGVGVYNCTDVLFAGNHVSENKEGNLNFENVTNGVFAYNELISNSHYNISVYSSKQLQINHNRIKGGDKSISSQARSSMDLSYNVIEESNVACYLAGGFITIKNNIFSKNKIFVDGERNYWGGAEITYNLIDCDIEPNNITNQRPEIHDNSIYNFTLGNISENSVRTPLVSIDDANSSFFENHDFGPDFSLKKDYLAYCNSLAKQMLDFDNTDSDMSLDEALGEPLLSRTEEVANNMMQMQTPNVDEKELEKDFEDKTLFSLLRLANYYISNPRANLNSKNVAIEAARKGCELSHWNNDVFIATLAAAYSESGNYDEAIKLQKKAISLIPDSEQINWMGNYKLRLKLYESGIPYHKGASDLKEEMPMAQWDFEESKGKIAKDASDYGFDVTLIGDPVWTQGKDGDAVELDGMDDYLKGGVLGLNSNTVTMTAWLKRNSNQNPWAGIVMSKGLQGSYGINLGNDNELRYHWGDSPTWQWNSDLIVPEGKWVFVALVVEPAKSTIYMSDGVLHYSVNSTDHSVDSFDGPIQIGYDDWDRFFKGSIDNVRIYNRALKLNEITMLANLEEADAFIAVFKSKIRDYREGKGDIGEIINETRKACEQTDWAIHKYITTFAEANAEDGNYEEAMKWQEKAIQLISPDDPSGLKNEYDMLLYLFQVKKEFEDKPQEIPSQAIPFMDHHYLLYKDRMDWKDAKDFAESVGGHLATITSKEESDWIIQTFPSDSAYYWLGGTDEISEGNWEWITGEEWNYTNWASGEPNNGRSSQHYLHLWSNKWDDDDMEVRQYSLIEWDN